MPLSTSAPIPAPVLPTRRTIHSEEPEFCLQATIAQASATISRCERLLGIRQLYQKQLSATGGHVRLHSMVEQVFVHPFVRVTDVAQRLDVTYPTAKSDLKKLAEVGIFAITRSSDPQNLLRAGSVPRGLRRHFGQHRRGHGIRRTSETPWQREPKGKRLNP